jgi:DNA-binding transcriptional LysR family regulator
MYFAISPPIARRIERVAFDQNVGAKRIQIRQLADLRDWSLFTYTPPFQILQNAKWFQTILGSSSIALQSNSTHALLAAACSGAGIAVLPRFVAREHEELVPVSEDVASHDILLITHPEVRRDPKVRVTADFLKQLATGPPGLC